MYPGSCFIPRIGFPLQNIYSSSFESTAARANTTVSTHSLGFICFLIIKWFVGKVEELCFHPLFSIFSFIIIIIFSVFHICCYLTVKHQLECSFKAKKIHLYCISDERKLLYAHLCSKTSLIKKKSQTAPVTIFLLFSYWVFIFVKYRQKLTAVNQYQTIFCLVLMMDWSCFDSSIQSAGSETKRSDKEGD